MSTKTLSPLSQAFVDTLFGASLTAEEKSPDTAAAYREGARAILEGREINDGTARFIAMVNAPATGPGRAFVNTGAITTDTTGDLFHDIFGPDISKAGLSLAMQTMGHLFGTYLLARMDDKMPRRGWHLQWVDGRPAPHFAHTIGRASCGHKRFGISHDKCGVDGCDHFVGKGRLKRVVHHHV